MSWQLHPRGYASSGRANTNGRAVTLMMHRLVNDTPQGLKTDHIDHDKLNNLCSNLRSASHTENMRYRVKNSNVTASRFKGVSRTKDGKRWLANIVVAKKHNYLGTFDTELEAAHAYDTAAKEIFGEFAFTNSK